MNKSALTAFLLSFLPGVGHAYLGRPVRAVLYGGSFFGPLGLLLLIGFINSGIDDGFMIFLMFVAMLSAVINMLDMIFLLISGKALGVHHVKQSFGGDSESIAGSVPLSYDEQQEKTRVIMLSFFPGLGHMSIGLMQRGITFLISFVGLLAIIIFLSVITGTGVLLIFLLALPVIWIYSMFDAMQQLQAKQRGEQLIDRAIFEDLESHVATGRKNKVLAIALAIFPGAGHLYLGMQKRGMQLMGGFLLAIYIMDNLRLSLFFFLLPLFWCFAFFDALQQTSRYERQELSDEPILNQFVPYQKWFGIALLGCGVYYLLNRVVADLVRTNLSRQIYDMYMGAIFMIPTIVISFVLIIVGLRLTFGSRMTPGAKQAIKPASSSSVFTKKEETK